MSDRYWDRVARDMETGYHLDPVMAEHKRRVHLEMLRRFCPLPAGGRVLKTDLFEEALGDDQVLLDWPSPESSVCGIDISFEIVRRAKDRFAAAGRSVAVAVADARRLPFRDGAFDALFSCSTLDHFTDRADLLAGVREASRVLRTGGDLALTLDNPRARFYRLVRWLGRRGKIRFLLGVTMTEEELRRDLPGTGLEIAAVEALYHVPRLVFTAFLRGVRAARLRFLDEPLLGALDRAERRPGAGCRFRGGWYTAFHLKRRNGPGEGDHRRPPT